MKYSLILRNIIWLFIENARERYAHFDRSDIRFEKYQTYRYRMLVTWNNLLWL